MSETPQIRVGQRVRVTYEGTVTKAPSDATFEMDGRWWSQDDLHGFKVEFVPEVTE